MGNTSGRARARKGRVHAHLFTMCRSAFLFQEGRVEWVCWQRWVGVVHFFWWIILVVGSSEHNFRYFSWTCWGDIEYQLIVDGTTPLLLFTDASARRGPCQAAQLHGPTTLSQLGVSKQRKPNIPPLCGLSDPWWNHIEHSENHVITWCWTMLNRWTMLDVDQGILWPPNHLPGTLLQGHLSGAPLVSDTDQPLASDGDDDDDATPSRKDQSKFRVYKVNLSKLYPLGVQPWSALSSSESWRSPLFWYFRGPESHGRGFWRKSKVWQGSCHIGARILGCPKIGTGKSSCWSPSLH